MAEHVHDKFCHRLDCIDDPLPTKVKPDRDALVQAVLDALSVDDLRIAAKVVRRAIMAYDRADRLDAAADALAALREAQQPASGSLPSGKA